MRVTVAAKQALSRFHLFTLTLALSRQGRGDWFGAEMKCGDKMQQVRSTGAAQRPRQYEHRQSQVQAANLRPFSLDGRRTG
jgi:hypothetical protein